ncbi:hypothetical protein D0469_19255 [Peribacillus saganii]|uniref:RNase H type-1 domain-containing protein n=1 Tax=Peribacillus saganii TaxID=2303992 RepID=A0A372LE64_9BACI|nr:ribonuclease H family protein [Peribacillus saganii]RFU64088.1 hypothetical protein D0469_19255 [Peribacillus saganii]
MNVMIQWTYSMAKRPEAVFTSEYMKAAAALLVLEDLEKTGRVKNVEFKDEIGTTWTKKELVKLLTEMKEEPQDIIVYFDGGYVKEDGMAGAGIVIYYTHGKDKRRIRMNRLLEELDSNNEAEYAAFYEGVIQLEVLGVHHQAVTFKGDSQVVLNQLSGDWPCFEDTLNAWLDRIEAKLKQLGIRPVYEPIPRKENQEADKLATQALKGEFISSTINLTQT